MGYGLASSYKVSMDARGRMSFPAPLRALLGESFVLTEDSDFKGCIEGRSVEYHDSICQALESATSAYDFSFMETYIGSKTFDVTPDKAGRIIIPELLCNYAGIKAGEVLVVGAVTHVEIWDPARYDEFIEKHREEIRLMILEQRKKLRTNTGGVNNGTT